MLPSRSVPLSPSTTIIIFCTMSSGGISTSSSTSGSRTKSNVADYEISQSFDDGCMDFSRQTARRCQGWSTNARRGRREEKMKKKKKNMGPLQGTEIASTHIL